MNKSILSDEAISITLRDSFFKFITILGVKLQSNFNGSNTFGTMKICSRQGEFEPLRLYYRDRSRGINRDIFSIFFNMKAYCVYALESPH